MIAYLNSDYSSIDVLTEILQSILSNQLDQTLECAKQKGVKIHNLTLLYWCHPPAIPAQAGEVMTYWNSTWPSN